MKLTFVGDMKKNKTLLQIGLELSFLTYYMVIYKIIHVYYLNKSHNLYKINVIKIIREWSLQSPYKGLKKDNSKPVWNQTFSQQKNHLLPLEIQRNIIIGDDLAIVKKVMMLKEITNLNCKIHKRKSNCRNTKGQNGCKQNKSCREFFFAINFP